MNAAPPPLPACSICQTTLDPNRTCPRCRAPEDWHDQMEAVDFVVRRLKARDDGQLTDRQFQTLGDAYEKRKQAMASSASTQQVFARDKTFPPRDACWSCNSYLYKNSSHCTECGAPVTDAGARSLRYWLFFHHELQQHEESGWLTLRQAHEFQADTSERIERSAASWSRDRCSRSFRSARMNRRRGRADADAAAGRRRSRPNPKGRAGVSWRSCSIRRASSGCWRRGAP